jgi:hypothetical protein
MAFSHINLDAPASPPGRNDRCPCGSRRKVKACCGVDAWRFRPLRGRRRGVVPPDLAERVDQLAGDFSVRFLARTFLPARLGGLAPSALTEEERDELRELFDGQRDQVDLALEVLDRVGYGRMPGRRPRAERRYGERREQALAGVIGKLPRALAKRLPTSADTHRHGPNDGHDVYGQVRCSITLRAGHLGVLAAVGGLWHSRNPAAHPYAECSASELAQKITGRRRLGGKDIAHVHRLLSELVELELSATVNPPKDGSKPHRELEISSSPIERVERRLPDGRWIAIDEHEEALASADAAEGGMPTGDGTIRIHLADWVRRESADGSVARIDLRVFAHLRPVGQRLYALLQGSYRDSYDQAIEFYLAEPLRYTLGLRGRQHRAAQSVRTALNSLYDADHRYNRAPKWSIRARFANTNIPAFRIGPHRRGSAPTDRALKRGKCPAARPASLRGLTRLRVREQVHRIAENLQTAHGAERQTASVAGISAGPAQRAGP